MVNAYVPRMVELLQALAWAVIVDDAARARVSKNIDMRNLIKPPLKDVRARALRCDKDNWQVELALLGGVAQSNLGEGRAERLRRGNSTIKSPGVKTNST